jgi:predicted anti-sigma-YlaC factor YlaD
MIHIHQHGQKNKRDSKMTCTDHQRAISRFIDHEAKAAESSVLFEHLAQCAECRQFYDSIIAVGVELDIVRSSMDEATESSRAPGLAANRQPNHRVVDQKRIAPRPSTLAFVIVLMLVVSLLFSVNVTIEKPAQALPTETASQR